MNGTVAPPSSSSTAAATCWARTPSSSAICWAIFCAIGCSTGVVAGVVIRTPERGGGNRDGVARSSGEGRIWTRALRFFNPRRVGLCEATDNLERQDNLPNGNHARRFTLLGGLASTRLNPDLIIAGCIFGKVGRHHGIPSVCRSRRHSVHYPLRGGVLAADAASA